MEFPVDGGEKKRGKIPIFPSNKHVPSLEYSGLPTAQINITLVMNFLLWQSIQRRVTVCRQTLKFDAASLIFPFN
ncbi:hypothetical protein OROHE_027189 [Orobanche hederae]